MADARIVLNLNADIQRCQTMTLFQHISWVFTFHCRIFASVFFPRQITLKQAFSGTKSAPLLAMNLFLRETSQASDMSLKLAPYLWSGPWSEMSCHFWERMSLTHCSVWFTWCATSKLQHFYFVNIRPSRFLFVSPLIYFLGLVQISSTVGLGGWGEEGETICLSKWAIKPLDTKMAQVWFV